MNEVAVSKSFQERMFEKIKTDMASLMSDEEMKKLVETSIERLYFTGTVKKQSKYPYEVETEPEIFTVVRKAVEDQIKQQVKDYIGEHSDFYKKAITEVLEKGFTAIALGTIQNMMLAPMTSMQASFQSAMYDLINKLQQKGIQV